MMKNRKKTQSNTGRDSIAGINRDTLKKELSNPRKLMKHMERLEKILETREEFSAFLFPSEQLLEELDRIADSHQRELNAESDATLQREKILDYLLSQIINDEYVRNFERALMDFLKVSRGKKSVLKAVGSGLFFIEIHRRHPGILARNPLWDIVFDLSYQQAMRSSGGSLRESREKDEGELKLPAPKDFGLHDMEEFHAKILSDAISEIESGHVELGFSLDTILQGLRSYRKVSRRVAPEDIVEVLRDCYRREIGERERDDLIWGLEYAIDHGKVKNRESFQKVYDGVSLLPASENPVMFALYYKCVLKFYRFLNPDELDAVKKILDNPDEVAPVISYGCMLYDSEAPRRALKTFEAALQMDPASGIAAFCKAFILWQTGSFNEARLFFEKSLKYQPANPDIPHVIDLIDGLNNGDDLPLEAEGIVNSICKHGMG